MTKTSLSRQLRSGKTEKEQVLWSWLRTKKQNGFKFRRQEPIGKYIVDFVCYEKRLIIEVDGGQHNDGDTIEKDQDRSHWLESQGFHVLRFWNNDIKENLEGVLLKINEYLK